MIKSEKNYDKKSKTKQKNEQTPIIFGVILNFEKIKTKARLRSA